MNPPLNFIPVISDLPGVSELFSGFATLDLGPQPPEQFSLAGAVSSGAKDLVPDEFFTGAGSGPSNDPPSAIIEWTLWTFVSNFLPTSTPNPIDPHATAFVRWDPREWLGGSPPEELPNQARIGATMWGLHEELQGPVDDCANGGLPSSDFLLATLQVTSDVKNAAPGQFGGKKEGKNLHWCFVMSEDPWANRTKKYRVQTLEKMIFNGLGVRTVFRAEIYRLPDDPEVQSAVFVGASPWISNIDIDNLGQELPPLSDSQVMWAFGPGFASEPSGGRVDVDSVASNYWDYNQ